MFAYVRFLAVAVHVFYRDCCFESRSSTFVLFIVTECLEYCSSGEAARGPWALSYPLEQDEAELDEPPAESRLCLIASKGQHRSQYLAVPSSLGDADCHRELDA